MVPKPFIYLFIIYECCGFQTGIFKSRIIAVIFLTIHVVLAVIFTISLFRFSLRLRDFGSSIYAINEIQQYTSALSAYWLIIIESYCKRATQQRFWLLLAKIQNDGCTGRGTGFRIWKHIFQLIDFFATINYFLFGYSGDFFQNDSALISYFAVVNLCLHRVFHYVFHLKIIEYELKLVECEVINSFKKVNGFGGVQLLKIRESYRLILEMVECVNSIFGWSNLATILFCFHFLLSELNFTYSYPSYASVEGNCYFDRNLSLNCSMFSMLMYYISALITWLVHLTMILHMTFHEPGHCLAVVRDIEWKNLMRN